MLARMPPTDRWPSRLVRPAAAASATKVLSNPGVAMVNGTFIHDRAEVCTGLA